MMKAGIYWLWCGVLAGAAIAGDGAHGGARGGGAIAKPGGRRVHGTIRTLPNGRYRNYGTGWAGMYGGYFGAPFYTGYDEPQQQPIEPAQAPGTTIVYYPAVTPRPDPPVHPVIHEYGPPAGDVPPPGVQSGPVLYLFAFRDDTIRAAMAWWIEGGTLHYLDREHKQREAPFTSVDVDLSTRLNRERRVPFSLQ